MKITDERAKEVLTDISSLRKYIKDLWQAVTTKITSDKEALELLDALSDTEIKGSCRSDVMDVLDKASYTVVSIINRADKHKTGLPITDDPYDKPIFIPSLSDQTRITNLDENPKNIIQLPKRP